MSRNRDNAVLREQQKERSHFLESQLEKTKREQEEYASMWESRLEKSSSEQKVSYKLILEFIRLPNAESSSSSLPSFFPFPSPSCQTREQSFMAELQEASARVMEEKKAGLELLSRFHSESRTRELSELRIRQLEEELARERDENAALIDRLNEDVRAERLVRISAHERMCSCMGLCARVCVGMRVCAYVYACMCLCVCVWECRAISC